jgi:cell division protein FtsI/penicillin-binding protein 2
MNQLRVRLLFVCSILIVIAIAVIARLFTIQIVNGNRYTERSRDQTQLRHILQAKRGTIYDRNGIPLSVTMDDKLTFNTDVFGVTPKKNTKQLLNRVYPLGEIGGSVLGYVGKDGYGLGGVEYAYDNYLHGEDGWIILQKDGKNNRYRKIGLPGREPIPGSDIYLTIDANIQKIVQNVLKQTVDNFKAKGGMCIVMDPFTGEILAMADEPSFNPNIPSQYKVENRQNRCISSVYEPGSTFKVITAATALQEKIKSENDLIDGNNGRYEIFNEVIRDHEPYGLLTFTKALSYSSNVCFAQIANEIGNERLFNYTRDFGFGTRSGIALPGEEGGILHSIKKWSGRSRVTVAIGQEISVTLLQITMAFAAVANGGVLVQPIITDKIVDSKGALLDSSEYKPVRRVMKEDVAARLRLMMKDVASDGTGKKASIEGVDVAGKTGTSQKPDSGRYSKWRSWSSFIGFVPADRPVLLCSVVIDEPAGGEMGGVAAAPAFKKIISQIVSHPELEYTEKILKKNTVPDKDKFERKKTLPYVCGLTKERAKEILDSMGIDYQYIGGGKKVSYQIPSAGTNIDNARVLSLYLDSSAVKNDAQSVPDCIGKDLRDAVNVMNLKGLQPYTRGFGRVLRQVPKPGTLIQSVKACTLYCSLEG